MNWIDRAIDTAQELNPRIKVHDRGEYPGLGRLFNLIFPNGNQTSIVLKSGDDLARKVTETVGRFERP